MAEQFILALDQGTTSSRAIIFNKEGAVVTISQKEFAQIFPNPGWVEHDANEIWETQLSVLKEVLKDASVTPDQIAAIGITNQRETTVLWDKETGEPVYNAIVWQDRRTAALCDELKENGKAELIKSKTGLVIDAYFSSTKIKWLLDNVPGARQKAKDGKLAFGTIDSWLLWNLTGGELHLTDVSNASRTMLFNIHTLEWDSELLQLFDIPVGILPKVESSSKVYGYTKNIFDQIKVPIAGIAGDQQAALFGQLCTTQGMVKNTYGTGCFMMMNTGESVINSNNNLLSTIAWKIDDQVTYALEGSVFIAGALIQWLRDGLGIINSSSEVEALACETASNGGVYIIPAFSGLGAPYWEQHARGSIFGITRGTNKNHIARAALESIAYQTSDILHAMENDSAISIKELRVDGAASNNELLMQFQADILNTLVVRPVVTETTALGAAYLAGLAVGYWENVEALQTQWKKQSTYQPQMDKATVSQLSTQWKRAITSTLFWSDQHQNEG